VIDVVCYYADFGRPYEPLLERMFTSARRVMPGCHTAFLTPTPRPWMHDMAAEVIALQAEPNLMTLARDRAVAMTSLMVVAKRPVLLVDPDIAFQRAPDFPDADVALLWRRKKVDQPINNGAIYARPGCPEFWKKYSHIAINLPKEIHHWWCDQIAFTTMTSVFRHPGDTFQVMDAKVHLWDAYKACAPVKQAEGTAWALHYKGALKGEEFEKFFPGRPDKRTAEAVAAF